MRIEHTFTIQAPIQTLWEFLFDVEQVGGCMPGVESIEALDAEMYEGTLKVKVGPIAASFQGKVRLLEVDPPHRLVAKAEGKDGRTASLVSGTFTAVLRPLAKDQTEVGYQIDAGVRGRLGQLGQGVMLEVARRLTTDFARCVEARLQGPTSRGCG
ncbi:MAG: SRPBCC family protein [Ardenticatenaceae bacterium]|nr:SRPBCC family protein [Ardenticatenaceae bacterium]